MAAKDYEICVGWRNAYFTKKTKVLKNGAVKMSMDRRPITAGEIVGLFEFYLRNWCEEHEGEYTVVITNDEGKEVFEAILLDKK